MSNENNMKSGNTNIWNLKEGDRITFTNKVNFKMDMLIQRVEEKSWYDQHGRNSWGTLSRIAKSKDFKIIRGEQ